MIRIIVQTDDAGMAANVGGHVHTTYKTFDVDLPEIEAFLREPKEAGYVHRHFVGAEIVIRKEIQQ